MKNRIAELEKLITYHQTKYYADESEISDSEFDVLWDELTLLDPQNSLLKKVGSEWQPDLFSMPANGNFEKAKHVIPMGSQEKAANEGEFSAWANKMQFDEYLVEYKLDGASLELQYENGTFTRAVTRGDGTVGDDISKNVRKMKGFVEKLSVPLYGGVRGEVIMSHTVHATHFPDKANCRNAANGLMKRKDGVGSEHLQIVCYDAWFGKNPATKTYTPNDLPFTNELEKIEWLTQQGFFVTDAKLCKTIQDVINYRELVTEKRKTLGFDIDGLVIKGLEIDYADAKRARPEKQIAFKFSLEEAITELLNVIWSESGATYTPIGEFKTVELAGTKVQRASLVNPNTIRSLGVHIGSYVVVTKRGEIIPKIERVLETQDNHMLFGTTAIEFPTICSTCGTALTDEGTRLFCPNVACEKRIHHRIEKWVNVLDIRDFGTTLIRTLYETKRLASISDMYTLTEDEIANLDGLGEKSAKKIVGSIQARREITLAKFIAGFDIENIGETLVQKIVDSGFNTLEKMLALTEDEIIAISGFAEITAHALQTGLQENKQEMLALTESGTIIIKTIDLENAKLAGLSFCFTGELHTMKRSGAETLVKDNGGSTKSSVVKGLRYLVTNDTTSGSAKNKKAQSLGIPIINEEAFLAMIHTNE